MGETARSHTHTYLILPFGDREGMTKGNVLTYRALPECKPLSTFLHTIPHLCPTHTRPPRQAGRFSQCQ